MMATTCFGYAARVRHDMQNKIPTVLCLAVFLATTLGWTGEAWAQTKLPRVGILSFFAITDSPAWEPYLKLFRQTLADRGWIEGKTVSFEYRSANSDPSQFSRAAIELVELKVDVIWAVSAPALRAAYAATHTIPVVAIDYTTDPVAEGYARSYARPGGNVTGVFLDAPEFVGKWFELLSAIVPDLSRVAVIWDPGPGTTHLDAVRSVAGSLDIKLQVLEVNKPDDIDTAFEALRGRPQALVILPSPIIYRQSPRLARLALKHRLPATSFARQFADAGGALAYGPEDFAAIRSNAILVAKILGGSKPAELPVERPTKIQLIVNLKTAKTLGLTIPQSILLRADEVIR